MSSLMKSLGIDRLSVAERLVLLDEIWESLIETTEGISLSDAHEADLRRRLDAHRDNPKAGSPWEEVVARLRGQAG